MVGMGGSDGVLVAVDRETETEGEEGRERNSSFFKLLFNVVVYIILISCI